MWQKLSPVGLSAQAISFAVIVVCATVSFADVVAPVELAPQEGIGGSVVDTDAGLSESGSDSGAGDAALGISAPTQLEPATGLLVTPAAEDAYDPATDPQNLARTGDWAEIDAKASQQPVAASDNQSEEGQAKSSASSGWLASVAKPTILLLIVVLIGSLLAYAAKSRGSHVGGAL